MCQGYRKGVDVFVDFFLCVCVLQWTASCAGAVSWFAASIENLLNPTLILWMSTNATESKPRASDPRNVIAAQVATMESKDATIWTQEWVTEILVVLAQVHKIVRVVRVC